MKLTTLVYIEKPLVLVTCTSHEAEIKPSSSSSQMAYRTETGTSCKVYLKQRFWLLVSN